jgi:hypothetical protein
MEPEVLENSPAPLGTLVEEHRQSGGGICDKIVVCR